MKTFSRFLLITILLSVLAGVGGYFLLDYKMNWSYCKTVPLYVVVKPEAAVSLHGADGGLNKDVENVILSSKVMGLAKDELKVKDEDEIMKHLTVKTVKGSNFIEISYEDADQSTAKDRVTKIAGIVRDNLGRYLTSIQSVEYYENDISTTTSKPNLDLYTAYIVAGMAGACCVVGFFAMLFSFAFKKKEEDDEAEYYRNYGEREAVVSMKEKKAKEKEQDKEKKEREKAREKERRKEEHRDREREKKNREDAELEFQEEVKAAEEKEATSWPVLPKEVSQEESQEEAAARYRAEFEMRAREQEAAKIREAEKKKQEEMQALEAARQAAEIQRRQEMEKKALEERARAEAEERARAEEEERLRQEREEAQRLEAQRMAEQEEERRLHEEIAKKMEQERARAEAEEKLRREAEEQRRIEAEKAVRENERKEETFKEGYQILGKIPR